MGAGSAKAPPSDVPPSASGGRLPEPASGTGSSMVPPSAPASAGGAVFPVPERPPEQAKLKKANHATAAARAMTPPGSRLICSRPDNRAIGNGFPTRKRTDNRPVQELAEVYFPIDSRQTRRAKAANKSVLPTAVSATPADNFPNSASAG